MRFEAEFYARVGFPVKSRKSAMAGVGVPEASDLGRDIEGLLMPGAGIGV